MTLFRHLAQKSWIWSWIAAFVVWLATISVTGGASAVGLTQAALTFAAFSIIVGIGQMFVITLGPGNIDLSVPATMTLAGTVALKLMNVENGMILPGLFVAILIGVAVGIGNYALIKRLRIPPIIATLEKTLYGRWISAIGQSMPAARMAGIPVDGTRFVTYVLCAVLAALAGYLLACFSGGAALNMGSEYLLMSIAVVVIGGTAVAGGDSNVPGIWGASLFMFLVVSMLNTYGLGAGVRLIMTGLIIISVIMLAGGRRPGAR